VVALEEDFVVFCGSSAGAEGFEFLGQAAEVSVFVVDAVDDGYCSSPFSCF